MDCICDHSKCLIFLKENMLSAEEMKGHRANSSETGHHFLGDFCMVLCSASQTMKTPRLLELAPSFKIIIIIIIIIF